jgi:low affinity Fe/Cu permease
MSSQTSDAILVKSKSRGTGASGTARAASGRKPADSPSLPSDSTSSPHSRWFPTFSRRLAALAGRGTTFAVAVLLIAAWAISGPIFHFSNTWQLVINTGTTIITFLMVFLIQNTQNRDTQALQIKLDELIRAVQGGHNALLDLEEMSEEELEEHRQRYIELAQTAKARLRRGESDEDCPQVKVELKSSGGAPGGAS